MLAPTWAYEFARLGSTRGNYNSRFIVADFWALIKFLCLHKRSDSQSNNNNNNCEWKQEQQWNEERREKKLQEMDTGLNFIAKRRRLLFW